ncbi:alpha-hydroxy-acid oxidizing protein [Allopusillimonas soli]|uniref:Alpha-hydroxy-acid oxidizing protein n=1 Tax=Allopusillimonas soli TaxID=659016 RepID=A0A853FC81_9BURK|nr:alpha-hydroxy acid oxidase [Allopusillimonas soli]NYT35666.1 alpha-hydroxy-acid oxidizing protein [Allopusillimonas soli]TEA76059.1 alpha-hydroxy-acid oxidizing protein [Allopusillimonas soli]
MKSATSPSPAVPPGIASAADYEIWARDHMDAGAWSYLDGAGADGITARANQAAFASIRLRSRVLRPLGGAHTRLSLHGHMHAHPIFIAPTAFQALAHPDAEHATAMAAAATGTAMVLSMQSGTAIEALQRTATPPLLWFQLYAQAQRRDTLALAHRALNAGARALVLTVDAPVNGVRNAEVRAGFRMPADIRPVHLDGLAPAHAKPAPLGGQPLFDTGMLDAAPTWDDIAWLREQINAPLWLKGIMDPDDAKRAAGLGLDGLIVSNHGGRCLDTLPATIEALPAIASAVGNSLPILMDGGIRRGTDILKAIALGARAVLIGRPVLHALATAGAPAVAHLIQMLRGELEVAMALTGCRCLDDIGPDVIWP